MSDLNDQQIIQLINGDQMGMHEGVQRLTDNIYPMNLTELMGGRDVGYFTCPRSGRGKLNKRSNSVGEWHNRVSRKIKDSETGVVIGTETELHLRPFNQGGSTWRCDEYISTNGRFLFCRVRPSQQSRQRQGQVHGQEEIHGQNGSPDASNADANLEGNNGLGGDEVDDGGLPVAGKNNAKLEVNGNVVPVVSNPQGQRQGQVHSHDEIHGQNGSPGASNAHLNLEGENEFGGDELDGGGLHVEVQDAAQPEVNGENEIPDVLNLQGQAQETVQVDDQSPYLYLDEGLDVRTWYDEMLCEVEMTENGEESLKAELPMNNDHLSLPDLRHLESSDWFENYY